MTTTDTPEKSRNEKPPDRKPWRTPHFAVLADMSDTSKPASTFETPVTGPS